MSSGLTTFPRDLLILCARAEIFTFGLAVSTNPSPFFVTSSAFTLTVCAPLVLLPSRRRPRRRRAPSTQPLPKSSLATPKRWNGSFVLTTPISYSTLCQNRA